MSESIHRNPTAQALEEIRTDEEVRADVQELGERDDQYGAIARVLLAVADGDRPSDEDLAAADLESIGQLYEDGE
ncbi:hypothetical protein [Saliphagus sp. LR7]|uniref:hypothetical protein n=1 Tax=Saliphagus sp. LR7 TaxID=2282654 RepID=UPI000DF80DEB|nr:hypothetical protein [Saliphagus sp. LR7]